MASRSGVKEVLGEIDDPGMEIEIAVRKYSVPHEFSEACIAQARTLPDKVRPQDKKHRVDLTDVPLVTIDGEDARDFDDAVYCEPAKARARQGLAPAGGDCRREPLCGDRFAIDIDAYDRATSVYFPRRVIPMLPEKLSNGLCSLNPEVERLCMVCDMLVSPPGRGPRLPVLSGGDVEPRALYLHRGGGHPGQYPRAGGARRKDRVSDLLNLHDVYRALLKRASSAARWTLRPPRPRSSATRTGASRRSCRARATTPTADRRGHAGGQRLQRRLHRCRASTPACTGCTKARHPRRRSPARLPQGHGRGPDHQRRTLAG
jgi:hypothetical protein